ncbi:MAG: hypothetical protein JO316_08960 [Abitibacteriaceae bacterium]|nr:hypothetical protein [Abditibacteriaceae bacterium]
MDSRQALDQINYMQQLLEDTRVRAADQHPFLILWGIIWMIGYTADIFLRGPLSGLIWLPLAVGGIIANMVIGKRQSQGRPETPLSKRMMWLNIISFSMLFLLPMVIGIRNENSLSAFFPFFVGFIYVLNGIFIGREMIMIGLWMMVTGIVALFVAPPMLYLWLAIAGGGGLLTSGILMRRQVQP